MNNIRLQGLKKLREQCNVSKEKLAKDLNLMNNSGVNFVVTADYITKIENRKQKQIDDTLLELLTRYFDVTLEDIINVPDNADTYICTPGTKKITITYNGTNPDLTSVIWKHSMEIDEHITNECVDRVTSLVIRRYGLINGKEEFVFFIKVLKHIFNTYSDYLKVSGYKMLSKQHEEQFIQDVVSEIQYGTELNVMRIAGLACKYYMDNLHLPYSEAESLAIHFIDVMLENDEL